MRGVLKFLAFLCVLLAVITLPLAIFFFDLGRVVFNEPFMTHLISEEVTQSELIPLALEWFSDREAQRRVESGEAQTWITEPDIIALMSLMDFADWKQVRYEVLPDEILIAWVGVTVRGGYAWIDSTDRVPQITWQMQPFKDRVSSEHGLNSIVIAYDNLAPCVQEEIDDFLARLAAAPAGEEVLYNLCEFPDPWHEDQFNDYLDALYRVAEKVPPQFKLTYELEQVPDTGGVGPTVLKQQLRTIRLLMLWAWLLPLALLVLALALAVRNRLDLSRWWGIPLATGGVLTLLPTLTYRAVITAFLAAGPLSETPELIRLEVIRILLRVAAAVFQPMLVQAIVVMLFGLLMILLPRLWPQKPQVEEAPKAQEDVA